MCVYWSRKRQNETYIHNSLLSIFWFIGLSLVFKKIFFQTSMSKHILFVLRFSWLFVLLYPFILSVLTYLEFLQLIIKAAWYSIVNVLQDWSSEIFRKVVPLSRCYIESRNVHSAREWANKKGLTHHHENLVYSSY